MCCTSTAGGTIIFWFMTPVYRQRGQCSRGSRSGGARTTCPSGICIWAAQSLVREQSRRAALKTNSLRLCFYVEQCFCRAAFFLINRLCYGKNFNSSQCKMNRKKHQSREGKGGRGNKVQSLSQDAQRLLLLNKCGTVVLTCNWKSSVLDSVLSISEPMNFARK